MLAHLKKLPLLKKPLWRNRAVLAFLAAGFALGIYSCGIEPFRLKVTAWPVATEKWNGHDELRIAILADPHMIWPWMTPAHLRRIVERTNRQAPDIVLLLGDYVATHPFGVQLDPVKALAPLLDLSPACGVYAVLGNHDLHPEGPWPDALRKIGIRVLVNQALPVSCHGQQFWIAGLGDMWWQEANIGDTLAQVTTPDPVIMMMHNPDTFSHMSPAVALSVAGHTHGGQVSFPLIGPLSVVIPSHFGKRYVYGHIVENGKHMIVSSGLGMSGIPVRFGVTPEIAVITLKGVSPQR